MSKGRSLMKRVYESSRLKIVYSLNIFIGNHIKSLNFHFIRGEIADPIVEPGLSSRIWLHGTAFCVADAPS
jgi:hypothetical protein